MAELHSIVWPDHVSLFVGGLLGCFHLLAIENRLLRMCVHLSLLQDLFSVPLGLCPGVELLGLALILCCRFGRTTK